MLANLTFTMFQPGLKSGGVGVVDKLGLGTVYDVMAETPVDWLDWMQNSSSAKLSRNTFQSCHI